MGQLFMANPSSSFVDYQVNAGATTPNRPCSLGPTPPKYTPFFVFASLERRPAPGVIGYGANGISATFRDEGSTWPEYSFGLSLESEVHSLDDDLIAYVFRGWLLLTDQRGAAVPPNPLMIEGSPSPPELQPSVNHTP